MTGITVVQHKRFKVISMKGKKQVGALTSLERGKLMTIVTCMNACGTYVPPLIVFPKKNMAQELMDGTPAGSIGDCHPSAWIQSHLFTKWFQHFINFTKPSKDDPILLVLDGHYTHTRNIDVINLARENNVIIICLPPHCTHKMQPMDVAFMKPLKAYYSQEIETWLRNNLGRTLSNKYVARLFGMAYEKAAAMTNSVNGFRKTGLFPCNRHIFTDFSIFDEEDLEQEIFNDGNANPENTSCVPPSIGNQLEPTEVLTNSGNPDENQRKQSGLVDENFPDEPQGLVSSKASSRVSVYDNAIPSTSSCVSPFVLNQGPRLHKNNYSSSKKTGAASIITGSPYNNSLVESLKKSKKKKIRKHRRNGQIKNRRQEKEKI